MKFKALMLILFIFILLKIWAIKVKKAMTKLVAGDGLDPQTINNEIEISLLT
jgi:hypothetical protein